MTAHQSTPYLKLPDTAWWKRSVSGRAASAINPHTAAGFTIASTDKVASAGSCFAQRISEALKEAGYGYLVTEPAPAFMTDEQARDCSYGVYSARYGNIYSSLQLLQLIQRAFDGFEPSEPLWRGKGGSYIDPFRPSVQPGGYFSEAECLWDRSTHLAAVRQMFQDLDIFIFTLGLTETWLCTADGAALPICPGAGVGGEFDPARYQFHNFGVTEVVQHMSQFLERLHAINSHAKVILTVSPVPLIATFENRHVLQATVYSKSVLRVACEELRRCFSNVEYFASYEIVTASGDSKPYFEEDRRGVTKAAVEHVIGCFKSQYMGGEPAAAPAPGPAASAPPAHDPTAPICDEDLILKALSAQMSGETA